MRQTIQKRLFLKRNLAVEAVSLLGEVITNNIAGRFKTLKPRVLQVNVNQRCNAKCGMCSIWQTKNPAEMSLDELKRVFGDPLFRTIEYTIVAGGEPTLRKDLAELVALMLETMPKLRKVSIPTTGLATERCVSMFSAIAKACAQRQVAFSVGLSLDGLGDVYKRVRGVPGGDKKVINTLVALKEASREIEFDISIGPTISGLNVYHMDELVQLGKKYEVDIAFQIAALSETYYNNADLKDNIAFSPEALVFLRKFLTEQIAQSPLVSEMPFYYEKALEMLEGGRRSMPCPYQDQGLVMDPTGDVYYCINSRSIGNLHERTASEIYYDPKNLEFRDRVKEETCPGCQMSCFVGVGLRKTLFPFVGFVVKQGLGRLAG
jgi:MoaA/NifB/PqqE/SkfB family radical SAM enzyme